MYTGQMTVDDRKQKVFQGRNNHSSESYELGVDNPNVSQLVAQGILAYYFKKDRRPGAKADGILLLNEYIDDKKLGLWQNQSYCSGVKRCGQEGCSYVVSTKQNINSREDHPTMVLVSSGPCSCYVVYIYPLNPTENGRRWFVAFNAKNDCIHNHPPPSEWKITPVVLQDITNVARSNIKVTPKDIQKGNYQPMVESLAAANIDCVRAVVRKARKDIDNIDNNRDILIASFPSNKECIDGTMTLSNNEAVGELVGKYQEMIHTILVERDSMEISAPLYNYNFWY